MVCDQWEVTSGFVGKRYVLMGHVNSGVCCIQGSLPKRADGRRVVHGLFPGAWDDLAHGHLSLGKLLRLLTHPSMDM